MMTTIVEKTTLEKTVAAEKGIPIAVDKRRALGRGLESLLPGGSRVVGGDPSGAPNLLAAGSATASSVVAASPGSGTAQTGTAGLAGAPASLAATLAEVHAMAMPPDGAAVLQLALDRIDHNPYQTRTKIPQEELQDLADSIQAHGVIQPIGASGEGRALFADHGRAAHARVETRRQGQDSSHRAACLRPAGGGDDDHREPATPGPQLL